MKFNKNILAILAIFCIILSAAAVCATEHATDVGADLNQTDDGHHGVIIPPDNSHDEARHAAGGDPYLNANEDGHNGTIIPPDVAHDEAALHNQTNATNHTPAAGGVAQNMTVHASNSKLPATGNPILALLAISAVLGGATLITRKK